MSELSREDRELLEAAGRAIRGRYRPGWHEIGAALRTPDGRVWTALNIDGFNSVCAEAAVIARAVAEGEEAFSAIVAVRYDPDADDLRVVSPCGRCRDLIAEFGDPLVIHPTAAGARAAPISELLPSPFEPRRSRRSPGS